MDYSHLFSYLVFLFLWIVSPGPCFAIVARNSIKYGIKAGFWTASGMIFCDAIFIFLAVIGVAEFLNHYPKILNAGKMIGAAYIFYIGIDIFLSTFKYKAEEETLKEKRHKDKPQKLFLKGFLTDASNPLAIVGMIAIVLSFIDLGTSVFQISFYSILVPVTTAYVTGMIAICFGNGIIRNFVMPYIKWFERFAGMTICTLAIIMIID